MTMWFNAAHYTPQVVTGLFDQALARIDEVQPPALRALVRETLANGRARSAVIDSMWGEYDLAGLIPLAEAITGPDWRGKPTAPSATIGG